MPRAPTGHWTDVNDQAPNGLRQEGELAAALPSVAPGTEHPKWLISCRADST
jgi:hypothetical protein